jgi:23S rRNA pseudouridine1911/1915/1917 synthase
VDNAKFSLPILFEGKDFLVVLKPAGVLTHQPKARTGSVPKAPDVASWLIAKKPEAALVGDRGPSGEVPERPGIVHRLDKDTSGVLILALSQPFFECLKGLFQRHEVVKTYETLVWGATPPRGVIDLPIGLKPGTTKHSTNARNLKMVKPAVTEYRTLETFSSPHGEFSLVELTPKTGRTHQLRVHLASLGHPIVGDALYTRRKDPWRLGRHFLHAKSIEFTLPTGERARFEADLPSELEHTLAELRAAR